jgi:hypothetical protein
MKTILLLTLCLLACDEQTRQQLIPTVAEEANKIGYYKDDRTGLCYATSFVSEYPFGTATIFSNVPCSSEVEKLLGK